MKKLYFLSLLCCCSLTALAQSASVVIWAYNSGNPRITGSATLTTITANTITTGNSDASRGYAVFDLSVIPAGAVLMSVSGGVDVSAYSAATPGAPDDFWNTNIYFGDLSTFGTAASLYTDMEGLTPLFTAPFGPGTGDPSLNPAYPAGLAALAGIIPAVPTPGPLPISLTYVTTRSTAPSPLSPAPPTTAIYTITGESGIEGVDADTSVVGHAPYLAITYCPQPTGVTASGPVGAICAGNSMSLTGSATGATSYIWTGPGGFTSYSADTTFSSAATSTGVFTLTAVNTCGTYSATATAQTASVTVVGGPISGATNVWVGFTTSLTNPTSGGTWSSSNTAIASIDPVSGIVTGEAPGTVTITYATSGCVYTTSVLVNASIFSQIPTISGGGGGLGFPLTAWYPFCGDTTDRALLIGEGPYPLSNNGNAITPAALTTDRFGVQDDAYAFDGVNNVMYTATYFPIATLTEEYTYSCWILADTIQNSVIIYNGNPNWTGYGFAINNGAMPFGTGPGSYVSVLFGGIQQFLPTEVSLNRWHNLLVKKNGNSYDFYIDNVSIGFFVSPFNAPVAGDVFQVGGDYMTTSIDSLNTVTFPYKGKIDDIAIYNRQLSVDEIDSLYNFNPDAVPFTVGNDTTICSDSITLFPSPPSPGNYYQWTTFSSGIGLDTLSIDSLIVVDPPAGVTGTVYALAVGKPFGCFYYDSVTVYKSPIPINIGTGPLSLCLGDTITLTDVIPHSSLSSFVWSTGDTSNSISVYSAGTYSVTIDSINRYTRVVDGVTYLDSNTCVGNASIVVNTYAVPIIGIADTYTNCQGVPDTVRPYVDTAYTYEWGSLGFAPSYFADTIVDAAAGLTQYWLKVTNTGCVGCSGGCSLYDTFSLFIAYDTLTFFGHDTAICLGQSLATSVTYILVTDNGIANYQWTPTAGIVVSNIPNPDITPDTSAEYILTVSYSHCPVIVDSFYLDVQPNPVIFPGNARSLCQYDTIHVSANATPAWYTNYSYLWSPSNELDAATTSTVVLNPVDTGNINLHITVSTPAGCSAIDSVQLYVHPGGFLADSLNRLVCPGDSIQLTPYANETLDAGTILSAFSWSPGTYLSDSTSPYPWVKAITTTGYKLIAASQYGCTDTVNYMVTVAAAAVINLGLDSVGIYPGETYLIPTQTNCVNFQWYPPLQINDTSIAAPTVNPVVNTTYTVTASTENNCTVTDSIKVSLIPNVYIDVPNAFTPGAGTNNLFKILVNGPEGSVALSYFRIYNRWGNMVFETNNINDGWDGTYKGKAQPFDVYVYEIEAQATDGTIFQRQGNVTLLR